MQAFGDGGQVLQLEVFLGKLDHEGGLIVDDDAAVAIEDFAAGSKQRNGLDAIALGQRAVGFVFANLKHPETGDQKQEHRHGGVLEDRDAAERELRIVAKQAAGGS